MSKQGRVEQGLTLATGATVGHLDDEALSAASAIEN